MKNWFKTFQSITLKWKEQLKDIYDDIFETIANYLLDNKNVTIANFGTFKISNRKARIGRNIATGETLTIKSHKTITFKISQNLKERLND